PIRNSLVQAPGCSFARTGPTSRHRRESRTAISPALRVNNQRADYPADERYHERAEERGREATEIEAGHECRRQRKADRVDNEKKEAERQKGKRQRQEDQERFHQRIHETEQDAGDDGGYRTRELHAR